MANDVYSNDNMQDAMDDALHSMTFTPQDVDNTLVAQFSAEEKLFAEVTINIAFDHGIFNENTPSVVWKPFSRIADEGDMINFQALNTLVKVVTKTRCAADKRPKIMPSTTLENEMVTVPGVEPLTNDALNTSETHLLNTKQTWHMES
jgi:hypothetical protein